MAAANQIPVKRKPISYRYVATNRDGKVAKGTIKAVNEVEAERLLIGQDYRPLKVEAIPSMFTLAQALPSFFTVKPREVIVFSRQLSTLLHSGITLLPALTILQGHLGAGRAFRKILGDIVTDLGSGISFSGAVNKHPQAFGDIYCRSITVGEKTGNLETVLTGMADYYEKQGQFAKKIGGALTYPMMVLGVGIVVIGILMTVVMPNLIKLFTDMNVQLPLPTRILIAITNVVNVYKFHLLIGGVILFAAVLGTAKQPFGRRLIDRIRLKAPVIGEPTLLGELARFSRTMSVLLVAGMHLQEIIEMMPQSTNNIIMRDAFSKLNERLLLGEGLSNPMARTGIFPPLLVQMVIVGEESNTLDFTMGVVADFYEVSASEKMTTMVALIGPLSTFGISLLVGFIALSVVMPMYTITGAFK